MVKAVPDDMHTVTPQLVCDGAAAAIEFRHSWSVAMHVRDVGPDEMRQAMRNA